MVEEEEEEKKEEKKEEEVMIVKVRENLVEQKEVVEVLDQALALGNNEDTAVKKMDQKQTIKKRGQNRNINVKEELVLI